MSACFLDLSHAVEHGVVTYKGLPAPTEPLKVAAVRADRKAAYEVEARAAAGLDRKSVV